MSLSQSTVMKLYQTVIEDTISSSREFFAEEGIDDQILLELRQSWESKVLASKAVDAPPPQELTQLPKTVPATAVKQKNQYTPTIVNNTAHQLKLVQQQKIQQQQQQQHLQAQPQQLQSSQQPPPPSQQQKQQQQQQQQPTQQPQQQQQQNSIVLPAEYANKFVPIQITLPAQAGSQETGPRVLSIQVPSAAIQGNMLQSILSGPVITNSMALPTHLATSLLQQHVNSVLAAQSISGIQTIQQQQQQQQQLQHNNQAFVSGNGTGSAKRTIAQVDGANDSSTSDDDDDDDDNLDDDVGDNDDDDEDDDKEQNSASDTEPLNSGDDVSDGDNGDLFETDNVIVCQYDKITRSRNKWKLYFKDGIMSLNGYDYVFQKATGDAEW